MRITKPTLLILPMHLPDASTVNLKRKDHSKSNQYQLVQILPWIVLALLTPAWTVERARSLGKVKKNNSLTKWHIQASQGVHQQANSAMIDDSTFLQNSTIMNQSPDEYPSGILAKEIHQIMDLKSPFQLKKELNNYLDENDIIWLLMTVIFKSKSDVYQDFIRASYMFPMCDKSNESIEQQQRAQSLGMRLIHTLVS